MQIGSDRRRRARPLLGTFVEIAVVDAARRDLDAAVEAAFAAAAKVHRLMSFHERESDVCRLNDGAWADPVRVHPWTFHVLQTALDMHRRSAGVFDIAVAPALQQLRLLPGLHNQLPSAPGVRATTEAIELLPGRRVRFRQPQLRIDLGGIAKGFAVDRAIEALRKHGMPMALVNAGGDVAAFGAPCNIDVRDPRDPSRLMLRLRLSNGAIASSAGRFDPFGAIGPTGLAIVDPRSSRPAHAALGATVRAPCCMLADALTKVVVIAGPSAGDLLAHYRADALLVRADGSVQMTHDLQSAVCLAA